MIKTRKEFFGGDSQVEGCKKKRCDGLTGDRGRERGSLHVPGGQRVGEGDPEGKKKELSKPSKDGHGTLEIIKKKTGTKQSGGKKNPSREKKKWSNPEGKAGSEKTR